MDRKIAVVLEKEEHNAEQITAIVQLILFSFLYAIYYFSPKGFQSARQIWFEPTNIVFLIYLPLLLVKAIHNWYSLKIKFGHYIYITLDIAILTALIFSFHIQYSQIFTLSLRSPTFLYYFIFLALRCLSYDKMKIFFTGIVSILAWIPMILYAMYSEQLKISRSFAEYIQSNTFIFGIEIDKLLSLFIVTIVCGIAVHRKRNLLEIFSKRAVQISKMEKLIGKDAYDAASSNFNDLQPGNSINRMAATMMIDLRNFSNLTYAHSAANLMTFLDEYYQIVARITFKNGGSIDKYMGDGILLHFGAVTKLDDYASRAMKAGEEIYIELNQWRQRKQLQGIEIDFGIAISIGEVIFGAIGHSDRMEITVIGESVNLSAKLEKHTKRLKLKYITTLKTFETAKRQGYRPSLGFNFKENEIVSGIPHKLDLVGLGDFS